MTLLEKIISFPSNGIKYKLCLHEKFNIMNTSIRNPGSHPGFGGGEGDLLQILVETLGIEFDYYIPKNAGFGEKKENNVWNGCQGMLQNGEVDVAMSALQNYWSNLFGYSSASYIDEELRFISKLPDPVTNPDVIFKTFDIYLWMTILVFIFLMTFVFYWVQGRRYSLIDQCFSKIAELLLQEPVAKIDRKFIEELLSLFWNVSALFLTLAYMAVILGVMMTPRRPMLLDNDEKLLEAAKKGKIKILTNPHTPFLNRIELSPQSKYREMAYMIRKNDWIMKTSMKESLISLLESNHAIATSTRLRQVFIPDGYKVLLSEDCFFYTARISFLMSRSWPLKKRYSEAVTRIVENRIFERDFKIFLYKYRSLLNLPEVPETYHIRALSLIDLQGAFMLLGIGHGVATIVLIFEILTLKLRKKCIKKSAATELKYSEDNGKNEHAEEVGENLN